MAVDELATGGLLPNPHGLHVVDYPWEDLPAAAWVDRGQREDGLWVLELRPPFIPPGYRDLIRDDGDGTSFLLCLTTRQRTDLERRWASQMVSEAAAGAELRAARDERAALAGAGIVPDTAGTATRCAERRKLLAEAFEALETAGTFGKRGLRPTQRQVARQAAIDRSTLGRWIRECHLVWPPPVSHNVKHE